MNRAQQLIARIDEQGGFAPLEDGYQRFWPDGKGALSASDLRAIADELDRRNQVWDEQVEAYFSNQGLHQDQSLGERAKAMDELYRVQGVWE